MSPFTAEQLQALAVMFLKLNQYAFNTDLVFFGFWCILTGYLIFRSTFLPRALGVLLTISGLGWVTYLYPPLAYRLPVHLCRLRPRGNTSGAMAHRDECERSTMERAMPAPHESAVYSPQADSQVVTLKQDNFAQPSRDVLPGGWSATQKPCGSWQKISISNKGLQQIPSYGGVGSEFGSEVSLRTIRLNG